MCSNLDSCACHSFRGGQFYLVDPAALVKGERAMASREVEWRASGDLVIFAANRHETAASGQARNWLHGFREVAAGPGGAASSHLAVVGLME